MSPDGELGRGMCRREKNATEAGAGRFEKPAPDRREARSRGSRGTRQPKTVVEVPLTGLSFDVMPRTYRLSMHCRPARCRHACGGMLRLVIHRRRMSFICPIRSPVDDRRRGPRLSDWASRTHDQRAAYQNQRNRTAEHEGPFCSREEAGKLFAANASLDARMTNPPPNRCESPHGRKPTAITAAGRASAMPSRGRPRRGRPTRSRAARPMPSTARAGDRPRRIA